MLLRPESGGGERERPRDEHINQERDPDLNTSTLSVARVYQIRLLWELGQDKSMAVGECHSLKVQREFSSSLN
jgi:hypothetical protein